MTDELRALAYAERIIATSPADSETHHLARQYLAMRALLKDLQWAGAEMDCADDADPVLQHVCPVCGGDQKSTPLRLRAGHAPDCRLAAFIAEPRPPGR